MATLAHAHMELTLSNEPLQDLETPLIALGLVQDGEWSGNLQETDELGPVASTLRGLNSAVGGLIQASLKAGSFRGRADESLLLHGLTSEGSIRRVLLLGLGVKGEVDSDTIRNASARAVRKAESLRLSSFHLRVCPPVELPWERVAEAAAEGAVLAAWDYRELRSSPEDPADARPPAVDTASFSFGVDGSLPETADHDALIRALERGKFLAEGANLARTLQQRPGNIATPEHLANVALEMGSKYGLEIEILGPREMEAEGMGALLSVARGSDQEPRLIIMRHHGTQTGAHPVALVGKGLTFDAGGISIKPAQGMEDMKFDMSGGAAVIGAMVTIARMGLATPVVGVIPASENLINGSANKPGDVIRTRAGKTVEIINTDAEGRLILADALHYVVDRFSPEAVVDCATLTGACVMALGHHAAAVLGTDEALIDALREAGERSGERCWPLPLWKPYARQLDSSVADLKNVGGRPAGTITAAHFLRNFVGETPWAHLDIAGTAYGEARSPWQRQGGYGFPARLLVQWVRGREGL